MRTRLTNEKEIEAFDTENKYDPFTGFEFKFESILRTKRDKHSISWRGTMLNQAIKILEKRNYFDDYDDWDLTFNYYGFNEQSGEDTILTCSIIVNHVLN